MKNFRLMVLAVAAALVLSPAASALAEGNFYLTPKIGFAWTKAKADFNGDLTDGDSGSKNMMPLGLAFGYDFNPVRVEFEYAYRGKKEMFNSQESNYGPYHLNNSQKGKFGAQSFFVNGYFDIHNDSPITPYVGLGLGLARVSAEYHLVSSGGGTTYDLNGSKTKTSFAWNIGAGAAWAINDVMSLDLGYRYVDFGKINFDLQVPPAGHHPSADVKATAHEVMLGLRFNF